MKKKMLLTAALAVSLAVLLLTQALLMPKYMDNTKEGALIAEYYDNAGNNDVISSVTARFMRTSPPLPFGRSMAFPLISEAAPSN
jgi:hypothetical protein